MVATHCKPSGSLAANQVGVPRCDAPSVKMNDATGGAGQRRGRILMLPGVGGSSNAGPFYEPSSVGGQMPVGNTFRADLNTDGWQTVQVNDMTGFAGQTAMQTDVLNDAGYGSRFLTSNLLYFDHIMDFCNKNYGGAMPTIVLGMSYGAWLAGQLAINRTTGPYAIVGAYIHCNVNDWSAIGLSPYNTYTTAQWAGMNLSTTALNAITIPARVTWGNTDNFITGGNSTTYPPVAAISMMSNACTALGGTVTGSAGTTVGSGTWLGPGHGMVTGTGQSEGHSWDGGGANTPDSPDCLTWFSGVIDPIYAKAF